MDETPWRTLDYVAAVPTLLPDALLPHLAVGAHILELDCGRGAVCRFLAERGMLVTGIDVNDAAIAAARTSASPKCEAMTFTAADILREPAVLHRQTFDGIVMIRFLTCFPYADDRRRLLITARRALKPNGILYVRDFLLSHGYQARYEDAVRLGMPYGNFPVFEAGGTLRFVAHHHSESEAMAILDGCEPMSFRIEESLSMNGNPCTMFELIGCPTTLLD